MNRSDAVFALTKLKSQLLSIVQQLSSTGVKFNGAVCGLLGHVHMMAIDGKEGLVGRDVSMDTASDMLLSLGETQIEKMDISMFKKVCHQLSLHVYQCTMFNTAQYGVIQIWYLSSATSKAHSSWVVYSATT